MMIYCKQAFRFSFVIYFAILQSYSYVYYLFIVYVLLLYKTTHFAAQGGVFRLWLTIIEKAGKI